MSRWSAALAGTKCGFGEGHDVPEDAPIYLMAGKIVRCLAHSPPHAVIDYDAIDAVRLEREAGRVAETTNVNLVGGRPGGGKTAGFANFAQTVAPERMQKGLTRRGIRAPKPFADVADDPVIRRLAGEDAK